ncbi:MAG: glucose-6-phosphate isomerase [Campylobacterota bacterium]|nr:glucose-6-phosphate isomerase [Campylobacterota bacterium]
MLKFDARFEYKTNKKSQKFIEEAYLQLVKESDEVGYYSLPEKSLTLLKEVNSYIKESKDLSKNSITDIVVIGIGGSSLGTKAIDAALKSKKANSIKLHFLENSDPVNLTSTLENISKKSTIFVVISKSGTTIETTSVFKYVLSRYEIDLNSKDSNKIIAITDKNSPLWNFASKYDITKFAISQNVGGRFSVLSAVGVVPLAIAGYDVEELLNGALNFQKRFFKQKEMELMKKAYFYYAESKFETTNVLFSYASELDFFNKWYVQLWAESLGKLNKKDKKVGLTPVGLVGSVDQHSFLQLVMQGPEDKTMTFIKVEDFENDATIPDIKLDFLDGIDYVNNHSFNTLINAQCMATLESVEDEGIPVDLISMDKLSAENIGALIYYYELLTSAVGAMLKINTYDQPGVEFGKKKLVKKFTKKS